MRPRSDENLDEFLSEFDRMDSAVRAHVLESVDDTAANLLLNNPWLHDQNEERLNPDRAISVLERAKELARSWRSPRLRRAAYIAIAVMHNEYRHEPDAALEALRIAADEFGASDGT